jgi:hypothetical protein
VGVEEQVEWWLRWLIEGDRQWERHEQQQHQQQEEHSLIQAENVDRGERRGKQRTRSDADAATISDSQIGGNQFNFC